MGKPTPDTERQPICIFRFLRTVSSWFCVAGLEQIIIHYDDKESTAPRERCMHSLSMKRRQRPTRRKDSTKVYFPSCILNDVVRLVSTTSFNQPCSLSQWMAGQSSVQTPMTNLFPCKFHQNRKLIPQSFPCNSIHFPAVDFCCAATTHPHFSISFA